MSPYRRPARMICRHAWELRRRVTGRDPGLDFTFEWTCADCGATPPWWLEVLLDLGFTGLRPPGE